jgi:SnoaL-like domain
MSERPVSRALPFRLRSRAAPLALALACGCKGPEGPPRGGIEQARVGAAESLYGLHRAASEANEQAYFDLFAPGAVFLGTDPAERWTLEEFRAWAHPHFADGHGWSYSVVERHLELAPDLQTAWFDERLSNASYGECRGTGVLRRLGEGWKVAQYNLTIPVPNELAGDLVRRIRESAPAAH